MSYDGKVLRRASARYDEDKQRRAEEFRARRRRCYAEEPRLEEIDRELSRTMAKIIASGLRRGTDPRSAIQTLREENLALQRERGELLKTMGYAADYLVETPACPLCGDTGWVDSEMCRCLRAYYTREQNAELSQMLDLGSKSFDTFDLSYYSDTETYNRKKTARENMEDVREKCSGFARYFPSRLKNLLFTGRPGLGKTFLSACIAREVSRKGYSVVYDTATHVFSRFEAQKFNRDSDEDADDDVRRVLRCDLLILDDLGTEMANTLVQSALYQIVNTRLSQDKYTIISTNLRPAELEERYGEAVYSRLRGEYEFLPFYGDDIRQMKKR